METEEMNKVIAEFMGIEWKIIDRANYPKGNHNYHITLDGFIDVEKYGGKDFLYTTLNLKYHSSWDWQIPVWSKIVIESQKRAMDESSALRHNTLLDNYEIAVCGNNPGYGCTLIFKAIIIEWYNTQP